MTGSQRSSVSFLQGSGHALADPAAVPWADVFGRFLHLSLGVAVNSPPMPLRNVLSQVPHPGFSAPAQATAPESSVVAESCPQPLRAGAPTSSSACPTGSPRPLPGRLVPGHQGAAGMGPGFRHSDTLPRPLQLGPWDTAHCTLPPSAASAHPQVTASTTDSTLGD